MKRPIVILAVALPAIALAACGSSNSNSGGSGSSGSGSSQSESASNGGTSVLKEATKPKVGRVLVDAKGFTLYRYTPDGHQGKSVCMGQCIRFWPPATVKGAGPFTVSGVKGTIRTTTRPDGARQLVLNGMPLYRFVKDTSKADANGQGFEHIWFVLPAKKASSTSNANAGASHTTTKKTSGGGYGY
jgi:predicted lipoprotein with Yx(FWY)xxD motif